MKLAVSLLLALALSACVGPTVNPNDPQAVARNVHVQRDEFRKVTVFTGPSALDELDLVLLRAFRSDGGSTSIEIYLRWQYEDSRFHGYRSALDSNGNQLSVRNISQNVVTCKAAWACVYAENVAVNVTRAYLENNRQTGIRFKLIGDGGESVFSLPPAYIAGFLAAVK
jgi:hypothetical protein